MVKISHRNMVTQTSTYLIKQHGVFNVKPPNKAESKHWHLKRGFSKYFQMVVTPAVIKNE